MRIHIQATKRKSKTWQMIPVMFHSGLFGPWTDTLEEQVIYLERRKKLYNIQFQPIILKCIDWSSSLAGWRDQSGCQPNLGRFYFFSRSDPEKMNSVFFLPFTLTDRVRLSNPSLTQNIICDWTFLPPHLHTPFLYISQVSQYCFEILPLDSKTHLIWGNVFFCWIFYLFFDCMYIYLKYLYV